MGTRPDDTRPPAVETLIVAGTHYEDEDVVGECSAPVFAKLRTRLAREAGIDIKALQTLAKPLDRASTKGDPLLDFLVAAFLRTELYRCRETARAIDRIVAKWPLHDPMRNDALQLTEALARAGEADFVTFEDVPDQGNGDELSEREAS